MLDVGEDTVKELINRGFSKSEAYGLTHDYFATVNQDPTKAPQLIKMATQKLAGAANIAAQNQPQLATINGQTTTIIPTSFIQLWLASLDIFSLLTTSPGTFGLNNSGPSSPTQ